MFPQFLPDPLFLPTHPILCSPSHFQRKKLYIFKKQETNKPHKNENKKQRGKDQ